MQHASAIAPAENCTPSVASVSQLDRRPWVVRVRTAMKGTDLPLGARAVGLCIASYFDFAGTWAVSREALADELDCDPRTLTRYLQKLKAANILEVHAGGSDGRAWSRYSTGSAIAKMAPARRREPATGGADAPWQGGRIDPPIVSCSGSGSSRASKPLSTSGTQPPKKRHDPRDDDKYICPRCKHTWSTRWGTVCFQCGHDTTQEPPRDEPEGRLLNTKAGSGLKALHTCGSCGRMWGQKHGGRCHGCGGQARAEMEKATAAAERHDVLQAQRLQAEVDNRPVKCTRCGYERAKRADLADIGRCTHCMKLTDAEAADLAQKGKRLHARMVKAWNDRDHVRGKAAANKLTALYAARRA